MCRAVYYITHALGHDKWHMLLDYLKWLDSTSTTVQQRNEVGRVLAN
jgi:hypothetical protein